MKTIWPAVVFIFLLLAGSAFVLPKTNQVETITAFSAPELSSTVTPGPTAAPTSEPSSPPSGRGEEVVLTWEGDPLPDDNQAECRSLRLTAAGQAMLGPCGAVENPGQMLAGQAREWSEMLVRFAPFTAETIQGRVDFQGQGQITSPAWQRAIAAWARFTYLELSSGRVSASVRTVLSWWVGEVADRPGYCRHLVVLISGYAYTDILPCDGHEAQAVAGGWLDTAEWDKFDAWLYQQAPLYQGDNYLSGLGTAEMSEDEVAALTDWATDVYTRLRNEAAATPPPAGSGIANPTPPASPTGAGTDY
jgi:hypothetical protein